MWRKQVSFIGTSTEVKEKIKNEDDKFAMAAIVPENAQIDFLKVSKSKNQLLAYSKGKLLKTYKISFGDNPIGHKEFEGDEKHLREFTL